mmetsp:Transcript_13671/g.19715  ORF Transcript_13671/g.19715 Transcript_13671/m.19715 type:complete len:109 (-) Transcript_13671:1043-1369(-)
MSPRPLRDTKKRIVVLTGKKEHPDLVVPTVPTTLVADCSVSSLANISRLERKQIGWMVCEIKKRPCGSQIKILLGELGGPAIWYDKGRTIFLRKEGEEIMGNDLLTST